MKFLVIDYETTGLKHGKHQAFQAGAAVVDFATLEVKDSIRITVQHDDRFEWDEGAAKIHGWTKEALKAFPTYAEGAKQLHAFIAQHFPAAFRPNPGKYDTLIIGGYNVPFDRDWLNEWMKEAGAPPIAYSYHVLEAHGVGAMLFSALRSEEAFNRVGIKRGAHDALDDVMATVQLYRMARHAGEAFLRGHPVFYDTDDLGQHVWRCGACLKEGGPYATEIEAEEAGDTHQDQATQTAPAAA